MYAILSCIQQTIYKLQLQENIETKHVGQLDEAYRVRPIKVSLAN